MMPALYISAPQGSKSPLSISLSRPKLSQLFCLLPSNLLYIISLLFFLDSFIVFTNLFSHDTFLTFLRNHNAAFPTLFPPHIDRLALSTDVLLSYPPPFSLASLLPIFLSGVALHSFMRQKGLLYSRLSFCLTFFNHFSHRTTWKHSQLNVHFRHKLNPNTKGSFLFMHQKQSVCRKFINVE